MIDLKCQVFKIKILLITVFSVFVTKKCTLVMLWFFSLRYTYNLLENLPNKDILDRRITLVKIKKTPLFNHLVNERLNKKKSF